MLLYELEVGCFLFHTQLNLHFLLTKYICISSCVAHFAQRAKVIELSNSKVVPFTHLLNENALFDWY